MGQGRLLDLQIVIYKIMRSDRNVFRVIQINCSLKHIFTDLVDVADNVNTTSKSFTNVTADTILNFLKEINLYTKIWLDNIHSKYMVLSF